MPIFCLSGCQPCAPADGVLIVGIRVLEYLCCLCGRHVVCLLPTRWEGNYFAQSSVLPAELQDENTSV
jgi:hypothetical protein